ncbi:MAG: hypothetical protein Q8P97_02435 [bacterium]|nr:hypothetical protein [bacterium]
MTDLLWPVWLLFVWVLQGSLLLAGVYLSYALFKNSIDFLSSRAAFLVPTFLFFVYFMIEFLVAFPERPEWFYSLIMLVSAALAPIPTFIAMYLARRIWEFMGFVVRLML